jgi:hypothetical protein
MAARHPIYAEANFTVDSSDGPPEEMITGIMARLKEYVEVHPEAGSAAVML